MFSGKTEELIRRLRAAIGNALQVQAFKPAADNRYSTADIVSHGGDRMPAQAIQSASEIPGRIPNDTKVIGVDEANFFAESLMPVAQQLADAGKRVIIAGLDTDFLGRPFPPIPDLLATSEYISKRLAVCSVCGAPAKHSRRLVHSHELLVVGAEDVYEPRCRRCFGRQAL